MGPMLVCLCKGVSDKKIRWLVQNGACSLREVMQTCQAGSDCGSCVGQVRELIEDAKATACSKELELDKASNE
jgi:bacterioferritin-associated ferredoxin